MATICIGQPGSKRLLLLTCHLKPRSVGANVMPILQMRKLRLIKAK